MVRTSVILPEPTFRQLGWIAQARKKTVSQTIREILDREIKSLEQARTKKMYEVLDDLEGVGEEGITDTSEKIDEILYGENGAWRGSSKDE